MTTKYTRRTILRNAASGGVALVVGANSASLAQPQLQRPSGSVGGQQRVATAGVVGNEPRRMERHPYRPRPAPAIPGYRGHHHTAKH